MKLGPLNDRPRRDPSRPGLPVLSSRQPEATGTDPPEAGVGADPRARPGARRGAVAAAAVGVLGLGIIVRFVATSPLWFDEALTVNIARLPLHRLGDALRHDGSPPLYYLLLHGWIRVFGTGDLAARSLSGLLGVAALPLMWFSGRRLGGRSAAWAAVLLLASSPFAVRYATEARMYSLVVLLVLAGGLAMAEVLERRSPPAMAALALTCGLLLLTHYWSFYLLAVVAVLLGTGAVRGVNRAGARRALGAVAAGALLFVPWLPSFLFQAARTGTPWSLPPKPRALIDTVIDFAGGDRFQGLVLGIGLFALMALGIWGRPSGPYRVELDLRRRSPALLLAVVAFATLALGIGAARLTGVAMVSRYASVVFPIVILLGALGIAVFADAPLRHGAVGLAVVVGFLGVGPDVIRPRTMAGPVASALEAEARSGDVVAYCPDQLGPSVSRLLPERLGLDQLTFPLGGSPELVDWVDYEAVTASADVGAFSRMLLGRAGGDHTVWVVWAPNSRPHKRMCEELLTALRQARPQERTVVKVATNTVERGGLVGYPPA